MLQRRVALKIVVANRPVPGKRGILFVESEIRNPANDWNLESTNKECEIHSVESRI